MKGGPIFARAGLWRDSAEWDPVCSGLVTDCNEAIQPIHDGMPVLLHRDEHDRWMHGSFDDIVGFVPGFVQAGHGVPDIYHRQTSTPRE